MSAEPRYKTIIELSPPAAEGKLTITITLTDADEIESGGVSKRLGDCTLAELGAFADQLEDELSTVFQQVHLSELADDSQLPLTIVIEDDSWLDHIVLLESRGSVNELPADVDPVAVDDEAHVSDEMPDSAEETRIQPFTDQSEIVETAAHEHAFEPDTGSEAGGTERQIALEQAAKTPTDEPVSHEATARPDIQYRTAGRVSPTWNHPNTVDILIDEGPLRQMQDHAASSMRREVAGVMIGPQPEKQPAGQYVVHVTDMIIALHTRMSGASVTYTPESWRYMNDILADRYPDGTMVMLGWYHTHPGFGIFLSNMDLFIHMNFFTQLWHIAYVLDPVARRSGFFAWDRSQSQVIPYRFPWPEWARDSW